MRMGNTPEYRAYNKALERCYKPEYKNYATYGGRGVSVADVFRVGDGKQCGYLCFLQHVGRRPTSKHSLDRIDVNGDYAPGNLRWATAKEQNRNKRNNIKVMHKGVEYTLADALDLKGVGRYKYAYRANKLGMSPQEAFNQI